MLRLRDLDLERHLADPALKPKFVTPMFDLIAPRYDDFTRLFSFGMDATWKRSLVAHAVAATRDPRQALDLACGTGDLAMAVADACPAVSVTGVDPAREMLALARARSAAGERGTADRIAYREGDMNALAAAAASVDLVTVGYGFRNSELGAALSECARVVKSGGILAVLDFYRPESALWRALFLGYLRAAGNLVGWWWHREPVAYGYIAHSIEAYVSVDGFTRAAADAGFDPVSIERHLGGGVGMHVLRRRG
jgi:demethylmenaquinone methyltransferase/2-methoxy-6-polyprenyl-1,4-benzoquinol methylase